MQSSSPGFVPAGMPVSRTRSGDLRMVVPSASVVFRFAALPSWHHARSFPLPAFRFAALADASRFHNGRAKVETPRRSALRAQPSTHLQERPSPARGWGDALETSSNVCVAQK